MGYDVDRNEALRRTIEGITHGSHNPKPGLTYIAYLKEEVAFATALANELSTKNVNTWVATRDIPIGVNFMQAQIAAMMRTKALVVVIGEGLERSGYIRTELNLAIAQKVTILPVLPKHLKDDRVTWERVRGDLKKNDHTYPLPQIQAFPTKDDYETLVPELHSAIRAI